MQFSLVHHEFRCLIDGVVASIPDHDNSVDASADHVRDLPLHLCRISGVVTDVHVFGLSEPEHQVGKNFGLGCRIEQRMNVQLADVGCALVSIRLSNKISGCAGVVAGLSGESC
jgi:hypothetical protein